MRRRVEVELTPIRVDSAGSEPFAAAKDLVSQFEVRGGRAPLRRGCYRVRITADPNAPCSAEVPLRIYPDLGAGPTSAGSHLLPPLVSGRSRGFIRLRGDARSLRLLFYGGHVPASSCTVELDRLPGLGAWAFLLVRAWQLYRAYPRSLLMKAARRILRPFRNRRTDRFMLRAARAFSEIFRATGGHRYRRWVERFDTLGPEDREGIRRHIATFDRTPLISVLMPTYDTPVDLLRRSVESVRNQLYPNWELCIADDGSSDAEVRRLLEEYAGLDPRIKVAFRAENGHISAATNSALELAEGAYIALLDHDDELSESALYHVVEEIRRHPRARLVYSDEDKIDEAGRRFDPYFKPDFSPELLLSQNYISHLGVYEADLLRQVGGLRAGFEGSQDYDLLLRVVERLAPDEVRHVPRVLYHWRTTRGSTSTGVGAKPYATAAARRAISEHLARTDPGAVVETAPSLPGYFRIRRPLDRDVPRVSVIVPTRNGADLLRACLDSVFARTRYPNFEVVIVDNGSDDPEASAYLARLESEGTARVLDYPGAFNYSAINNHAVRHSSGDILVLLNNDVVVVSDGWLEELVGQARRPEVGAVGARLLFPDGTIQHAGVVLGVGGVASHAFYGSSSREAKHFEHDRVLRNVSAVTGACLATRREVFDQVGGLDEVQLRIAYNDVDYCLKLLRAGLRVVYDPYVELIHHESKSRGADLEGEKLERFLREQAVAAKRWASFLSHDPFYNPNLTVASTDYALAWPPRSGAPWRRDP